MSAIWMAGIFLNLVLMKLAVEIGLLNRMAGLIALSPVILLQLLVFVVMFVIPRDGLPSIRLRIRRQEAIEAASAPEQPPTGALAGALLAVLIPFYGYYAGWGLLSNTLRDYSKIFLDTQWSRIDFLNPDLGPSALEVGSTIWVLAAVLVIWAIRRRAKARHARIEGGTWPMVVVACDATWALLALHVITGLQGEFVNWLAQFPGPQELIRGIFKPAEAAVTDAARHPVDWPPGFSLWPWLNSLFWYAVLPLIWFNLGAIVYGHDLDLMGEPTKRAAGRVLDRYQALPKPVIDFITKFWAGWIGLAKRWHAIVNGIWLAASAGFALTVSVLLLWRFADWLGRWSWIFASELIGPQDPLIWRVLAVPLSLLFGTPGQPQTGVVVCVMQFCVLVAGLELASRAQSAAARPA
ncbi:hypothetical protein [Paracoccus alkanivorans]|nr:hypothetical protein [Paracoccus alkanivorans]